MRVTVSGRHVAVSDEIRSYATEKAEKLSRYYDRLQSVDVVFAMDAGSQCVEVIAKADRHTNFVAKHEDHDAHASLDRALKELEGQLKKHKDRLRNRLHNGRHDGEEVAPSA